MTRARRYEPVSAYYGRADAMPAHIRAALTATQLSIPVEQGRPVLDTWHGVYLAEHRAVAHRRELRLHLREYP